MESRVVGKSLLDRAESGDPEAFEALIKNHAGSLESFIHFELARRFGGAVDAEDVQQETLLRAWQSIHRLRGREESIFRRWLCMIAKHVIQDRSRRLKRERAAFDSKLAILDSPRSKEGKWGRADAFLVARVDPPSKGVQRNERFERLQEAMRTLSPVHRKVVFLARVKGLPISGVGSLQDLKGRRFAFGDPESTIGRYLSQKALVEAGICARDIQFEYLHHHDAVVASVRQGHFDAGAAKEGALSESGDKDLKVLREVTTVCMPWVARGGLDAEVTRSFKNSLIAFKDPKILGPLKDKVTGFREATDEMFHQTRADIDHSKPFEGSDPPPPPARNFKRGDVNADGAINLSDAVFVLDYLFLGKSAPGCLKSADANVSGTIDLTDPIFLLNHLFLGGPAPSEPFLACGIDPTQGFLTCTAHLPCP